MPVSSNGGIYIEIGGTAEPLYKVLQQAKTEAGRIATDIASKTGNAISQRTASDISNKVAKSFGSLRSAVQASKADVAGLNDKFKGMANQLGLAGKQANQFSSAMQKAFQQRAAADVQRHLRDIQRQTGMTRKEMEALAKSMGTTFEGSSRSIAGAVSNLKMFGAALAATGVAYTMKALGNAGDYEHELWNMRKVTDESISAIKARIESLPASLGNVTDLAKGYYQTLSAGVTEPAKAMDVLTTASKLAAVAGVEQGDAIKALTKMLAGYKGEIADVATAADTLLDIEQFGQTSVAELVPVIGDISSVSKMAGVSYKEMAAGLAVVTQTAGSTAQATTQLQALFTALIKPSEKLGKVIASLGYESGAALMQKEGLAGGLNLIAQAAEKSKVSMEELLGSTEAIKAAAALASGEYSNLETTLEGIGAKAGRTGEAFESYQHTFSGLWDTIKNSLFDIGIAFAEQLVPSSKEGMEGLKIALDALKSIAEGVGAVVSKIASFVASIVKGIYSMLQGLKAAYAAQAEIEAEELAFVRERNKTLYAAFNKQENEMLAEYGLPGRGKAEAKAAGAGAAGGTTPSPVPKAAAKPNLPKLAANYKPVSFGGSGGKKGRSAGAGRKTRASGGGASGASQIESALQKIQDIREEIQKLNGETAGNSLDKKLREIAQAGEKAKLPLKEIADLQSAYTKAFQDNVIRDFNKALLELTGSAQEIRAAKMEETIEEWRKKFTEAKIPAEEMAAKLAELRAALAQKDKKEDEENATDWLSGLRRGMEKMKEDAENWGRHVEDIWTNAADSMTDAFTTFCTTGKASFSDLANSIISDLIRMITKAMIIQPLMDALGSGISGMFGGGSDFPGAGTDAIAPSANGNVFLGGSLAAFAGHVVDRPTLFSYGSRIPAYASGAGLMGEAGPEAIMPLTRMGNGRLGVEANGGGPMQMQLTIVDKTSNGVGVEDAQAQQNGMSMDMMISQIEQGIVRRASSGRSPLMNFIDKTRGTSNARRLY